MPKSSTKVESFVSPEEFRAVVVAVDKYPEFLPEVKKVEIKERGKDSLTAAFFVEVKVGGMDVKTEYTVAYKLGESEVSWTLLSSPTLTKNEGLWRLEETKDGETRRVLRERDRHDPAHPGGAAKDLRRSRASADDAALPGPRRGLTSDRTALGTRDAPARAMFSGF